MRSLPLCFFLLAAPAAAPAQRAPIHLDPVTRIGCVDCDGPELFSDVRDIAVSGDRIYVVEGALSPMIRVFDAGGVPIRAFGRRGDGPGEFRFPIHVGVGAGAVEVFDYGHGRFTRFDSAGTTLGSRLVNTAQFPILQRAPGGTVVYILTGEFGQTDQRVMRLADGDSTTVTIARLTSDFPIAVPDQPISRSPIAARPGAGVAVGDGRSQYRIRLFDDNGAVSRDIVRNIPRQRKTKGELDRERRRREFMAARMTAMLAERGGRRAVPAVAVDEERNHFRALEYDDLGRLWVQTGRGDPDETIFDVFDPAGRYLGELDIPHRTDVWTPGSGLLVAAIHDADGVQYIGVWRIR